MAKGLLESFQYSELTQIERAGNDRADMLSKAATTEIGELPGNVNIEFLGKPAFERGKIAPVEEAEKNWVTEMTEYLENGTLPEEADLARQIRKRSPRYTVIDGILYRRSFKHPLARCVSPSMAEKLLYEVHQGVCGGHPGARTLADKVISQGYYWPTLRQDATKLVKKCEECQRFGDVLRAPTTEQTPVTSSWPFDMWGFDAVGKLPTSKKKNFLLVAVDYFTKWIEARPVDANSEENAIKFIYEQVFCRFGMPRAIITDNGSNMSATFTKFCHSMNVNHWKSSVGRPEGNGQAEAANKLVVTALEKSLRGCKGKWAEELPACLWAVRTTVRGPTGETPFALTYGSEAMAPAEVALPNARVALYGENQNNLQRALELDLLEERRLQARMRMVNYKQKTKLHHDKRVRPRTFKVGDMVLRKLEATGATHKKFDPNWEGPLIIRGIVREGTYTLGRVDGTLLKNTWHADHLKKYYQ